MPNTNKSVLQVRAPLFERLIDDDPQHKAESHVKSTITLKQLRQSIRDEISMLLNTRESKIPFSFNDTKEYDSKTKLSNSYGLPDFSYFEHDKMIGIQRMAAHLANAIGRYEPRLKDVSVHALNYDTSKQCLYLEVKGKIIIDKYSEKYIFPVVIEDVHTRKK